MPGFVPANATIASADVKTASRNIFRSSIAIFLIRARRSQSTFGPQAALANPTI